MEADSARFRRQAVECPEDLSLWTKLYTVSQIMLAAMQEDRVGPALAEICSNLLGCEQFAIVEISEPAGRVKFLQAQDLSSELCVAVVSQAELLQSQIRCGTPQIPSDRTDQDAANLSELEVSALVPLWSEEESSGAILLFQLLPQRSGFDTEDREVLRLLSAYAGPCLRKETRG